MAALAGGAATGMYAGRERRRGVCPGVRRSQETRWRNGALWGRTSLSTHAATCAGRLPPRWGWHSGKRRGCANSQHGFVAGSTSSTWRRTNSHSFRSSGGACIEPGENDKRYRHHQPASRPGAQAPEHACRYLSLRIQTIQSCITARNPITTAGATLIRATMCVHICFPSNLPRAGPMERAPV